MRKAFEGAGIEGLWIDHKPLKTQTVLRKTCYAAAATSPGLDKSNCWGMVVIAHDPPRGSSVLGKWGNLR